MRFSYKTVLLAALIVLLLAACGNDGSTSNGTPGTESQLKILVERDSMYRVTLDDLWAAGFSAELLEFENINLLTAGENVPYAILNDAIVFYGSAPTGRYDQSRPYIIKTGEQGTAIAGNPANPVGTQLETIKTVTRIEENWEYEQRAAEVGDEVWFWERVVSSGDDAVVEFTMQLPAVAPKDAMLSIDLWGLTFAADIENDHEFDVLVNGTNVGEVVFDGQEYFTAELPIDGSLLQEGENTIVVDNSGPGAAFADQFYVNWLALEYDLPTVAINDAFVLSGNDGTVNLTGFSGEPIIFDATNPLKPAVVDATANEDGSVLFSVKEDQVVHAVGPDGYAQPAAIETLRVTELRDTANQADMLIVTTDQLSDALTPLVEARAAQGVNSVVVDVNDLYDEFGYGSTSPESIRAFVEYAYSEWAEPKPQYLFLVGDATTDTLGHRANHPDLPVAPPPNLVPSLMIEVAVGGETVSDARLADADGDLKPDLAVGRWPVDTAKEVESLVERTLAYETGSSAENAVFTFDTSEGSNEFSSFTNRIIEQSAFPDDGAKRFDGPTSAEVASEFNAGAWLVSYVGHGSLDMWGSEEVFSSEIVDEIDNENTPPIVLQFSCLTGQFANPTQDSISETFLKHDDGPVILIAATSLTLSTNQSPFAVGLLSALQDPNVERIGDALQAAKVDLETEDSAGLQEISDTFGLIGDPSALIVRPPVLASTSQ